jgi:WD40 repeat protein
MLNQYSFARLLSVCIVFGASFLSQTERIPSECYQHIPLDTYEEVISMDNMARITQLTQIENEHFSHFVSTPSGQTIVAMTPSITLIYGLNNSSNEMFFLEDCQPIDQITFSLDGTLATVLYKDSNLMELWDLASNSLLNIVNVEQDQSQVTSLTFDTSGEIFAWAISDISDADSDPWINNGSVYLYDLKSMAQVTVLSNVADIVNELHFSPDSQLLVFRGSYPGYSVDMQVWDVETETRYAYRESWLVVPAYSLNAPLAALAVTTSLGITDEYSHQVDLWNFETDTIVQSIPILGNTQREAFALPNRLPALALNSDASLVATGDDEGVIVLWDTSTGEALWSVQAYSRSVQQLEFIQDDKMLISLGTNDVMQSLQVWGIE